jgi:putative chitinase
VRTGCLDLADLDNVEAIRRRINGGLIGIDDCRMWLAKAKAAFTSAEPVHDWKWSQAQLQARGFYTGTIDGDAGPKTEAAVAAFIAAHPDKP